MREKIFRWDEISSFIDHLNIVKEKSKPNHSFGKIEIEALTEGRPGHFRAIFEPFWVIFGWFQSFRRDWKSFYQRKKLWNQLKVESFVIGKKESPEQRLLISFSKFSKDAIKNLITAIGQKKNRKSYLNTFCNFFRCKHCNNVTRDELGRRMESKTGM